MNEMETKCEEKYNKNSQHPLCYAIHGTLKISVQEMLPTMGKKSDNERKNSPIYSIQSFFGLIMYVLAKTKQQTADFPCKIVPTTRSSAMSKVTDNESMQNSVMVEINQHYYITYHSIGR
jgi:hypothetical protein